MKKMAAGDDDGSGDNGAVAGCMDEIANLMNFKKI